MKAMQALMRRSGVRYGRFMVFYLAGALLAGAASVATTWFSGQLGGVGVDGRGDIPAILLWMTAATALLLVVNTALAYSSKRFSERLAYKLRGAFLRHFGGVSYKELTARSSGDVVSLYTNDLTLAVRLVADDTFEILLEGIVLLLAVVLMLTVLPLATLVFLLLFPVMTLIQVKVSGPILGQRTETSRLRGKVNATVADSLQNTAAILAYGLEEETEQRFLDSYQPYFEQSMRATKSFTRLVCSGIIATILPLACMYVWAAATVAGGNMTAAEFIVFTTLAGAANGWLTMLSQRLGNLQSDAAAAGRIAEAMAAPEEDSPDTAPWQPVAGTPALAFSGVEFSYREGTAPVLNRLDLVVHEGEKIALVGASGCGKSTAMKLMLGLYIAQKGKVNVFTQNIEGLSKAALREHVAYVPQDSFLFPGSIRENLAGFGAADEKRLREACRNAGILSFIEQLPRGFDTGLQEAAANLSGGQRQRLSIARALYRKADIVLLDEATSALDPVVEREVLEAFYGSLQGRTAVVVAHRLSAVRACDRILLFEGGRIVESGSYEELMAKNGAFYALYQSQQAEEGEHVH